MSTSIVYEAGERVAKITLNRPQVRNALDQASLDALVESVARADADDEVWILEIHANGPHFCAGHDIREHVESTGGGDYFNPVFRALRSTHKPVIAAVRGLCLGGGAGIAFACDIRVASTTTRMGWPHARIGLASAGAPVSLARAIPKNIALELMFTSDQIDADRMLALGIANRVVDDALLESEVMRYRSKILANAPLAVRAAKEATLATQDLTYEEAVRVAREIHDRMLGSADAREGMRAFLEKRRPAWTAR